GTIQNSGAGNSNFLTGVRPIHAAGIQTGTTSPDVIDFGTFTVPSSVPLASASLIAGAFGGTLSAIRINGGTAVSITSTTESSASPFIGFVPLTLMPPPLPAWLAPGSAATWDAGTHSLTVTGAATIIADPGADAPVITASGASAQLSIAPTSGDHIIHVGG